MPRQAPGGVVFHVLNRGNERRTLFDNAGDYDAFVRVMAQTMRQAPMRLLAYCLMPNHWHLVVWPTAEGDLGRFMQRLTVTHVRRWREHRHAVGLGHLYQGAYKSFPVEQDRHFLVVCRYVERNALRAGLVGKKPQDKSSKDDGSGPERAESWRWSSLWQRHHGLEAGTEELPLLAPWPVACPGNWVERVNRPETAAELKAIRANVQRGRPLGSEAWIAATAERLGLSFTLRPRGRPRKEKK